MDIKPRNVTIRLSGTPGCELLLSKATVGDPECAKRDSETNEEREERTWRHKVHVNSEGNVYLRDTAFAKGLVSAAKFLNIKIPGEGKKTYTQRFKSGVLVIGHPELINPETGKAYQPETMTGKLIFVPSGGGGGGGSTRVNRRFPCFQSWTCDVNLMVVDEIINDDILKRVLDAFGLFIGIGAMRAENGGGNGRFTCEIL